MAFPHVRWKTCGGVKQGKKIIPAAGWRADCRIARANREMDEEAIIQVKETTQTKAVWAQVVKSDNSGCVLEVGTAEVC